MDKPFDLFEPCTFIPDNRPLLPKTVHSKSFGPSSLTPWPVHSDPRPSTLDRTPREQQNFYKLDHMVNFSNFCQKNIFNVIYS